MDRTTEVLSSYVCRLSYEQLPKEVVHHTKRTLIDTIGCALGGFQAEPSHLARRLAQQISCEIPSQIMGTRDYSSSDMAGFANGCMIRYLDFNDSYASRGGGHPSDMIAAILSTAEATGCDGRTTITAIVAAYEVFCRLSDQIVVGELGWDHGALSVVGAVCGVGKVLGFDKTTMSHAISLASVSNLPLGVTRQGELSMWKGCAAANASRAAIFSAQLAQGGMTGPESPFWGRYGFWQQIVGLPVDIAPFNNDKTGFRITSNILKYYPSQTHTQGPINLAVELRLKVNISDIVDVCIRSYDKAFTSAAQEPEKWAPKNRETADHSIPYLVAYAFQYGTITPYSFTDNYLNDHRIRTLINTISVVEDPDYTARFAAEYNCHMRVTTKTGEEITAKVMHPKGFPGNMLSDTEVESKFRSLATEVLPTHRCSQILNIMWSFEEATDLRGFFDSLVIEL